MADERPADLGVKGLTLEGVGLGLSEKIRGIQGIVGGIDQDGLFALGLVRGHFQRVAHAGGKGKGRLHVPGVADVGVVEGNHVLVGRVGQRRVESQIAGAGVSHLRLVNDAKCG